MIQMYSETMVLSTGGALDSPAGLIVRHGSHVTLTCWGMRSPGLQVGQRCGKRMQPAMWRENADLGAAGDMARECRFTLLEFRIVFRFLLAPFSLHFRFIFAVDATLTMVTFGLLLDHFGT